MIIKPTNTDDSLAIQFDPNQETVADILLQYAAIQMLGQSTKPEKLAEIIRFSLGDVTDVLPIDKGGEFLRHFRLLVSLIAEEARHAGY